MQPIIVYWGSQTTLINWILNPEIQHSNTAQQYSNCLGRNYFGRIANKYSNATNRFRVTNPFRIQLRCNGFWLLIAIPLRLQCNQPKIMSFCDRIAAKLNQLCCIVSFSQYTNHILTLDIPLSLAETYWCLPYEG